MPSKCAHALKGSRGRMALWKAKGWSLRPFEALMHSSRAHSFELKEYAQGKNWFLEGCTSEQGRGKGLRGVICALRGCMAHF